MLHLVSPIHPTTHPQLSLDFSANSRLTASPRYKALRIIHIALDAASPLLFISCKLFFSSLRFLELLQDMSCSLCFLGDNCAFGFVNCPFAVILFSTQVKRSMVVLHAVLQVHIWSPNNVQMRTLWRLSLAYFSTRFLSCCHCLQHRNQAAVCFTARLLLRDSKIAAAQRGFRNSKHEEEVHPSSGDTAQAHTSGHVSRNWTWSVEKAAPVWTQSVSDISLTSDAESRRTCHELRYQHHSAPHTTRSKTGVLECCETERLCCTHNSPRGCAFRASCLHMSYFCVPKHEPLKTHSSTLKAPWPYPKAPLTLKHRAPHSWLHLRLPNVLMVHLEQHHSCSPSRRPSRCCQAVSYRLRRS